MINMGRTIIIGEVGECFNGDLGIAERLIFESKDAGCDIVKFQTLDDENISDDDPERDWFLKVALNHEKVIHLTKCAEKYDIDILFTPDDIRTAKMILQVGSKQVKIASSVMTDQEYIQFINANFTRVFMSTGMCSLDEVSEAVDCLKDVKELYVLHCISEYPTGPLLEQRGLKALSPADVRLNMMQMLMRIFPQHKIGYSDHTDGILAPVAAAAMGAQVIEKHITLDRMTPIANFMQGKEYLGTDHVLSIEPAELREMVRQIREVEQMMGLWKWERSPGEIILREFLRKRFKGDLS
jgi:N,N'-diacetyllegionaminate synthase